MLVSLNAISKPQTLTEALEKLKQPEVRPLYGGGLVRANSTETEEAVDLSGCGLDKIELIDNTLSIGGAARLESIVAFCADLRGEVAHSLAEILKQEAPITLRNALALGDVLTEANPA